MERNDAERFTLLWTKTQPTVAAYIAAVVHDMHRAEDVLHQVALVLVRKFDQYDDQQPFVRWALGVARLEVLKHYKKCSGDKHLFATEVVEQIADAYADSAADLDDRRMALRQCLEEVKGRSREALRLRYINGLKPAAIAAQLSISATATRALLSRVRAALRDCITRQVKETAPK